MVGTDCNSANIKLLIKIIIAELLNRDPVEAQSQFSPCMYPVLSEEIRRCS